MKRVTIMIFILMGGLVAFSQEDESIMTGNDKQLQTLFGDPVSHGAYGGLSFYYSSIDGKNAYLAGIRGGWIIDHRLVIGLAGFGFANDIYMDDVLNGKGFDLVGGYGGLLIEPIIMPRYPVHLSFPVIIGAGGAAYIDQHYWNNEYHDWFTEDSDAFFVIEPGVEVEINLINHFRIAFGVSYRHTEDLKLINTNTDVLNGFNYGMSLKFGKF